MLQVTLTSVTDGSTALRHLLEDGRWIFSPAGEYHDLLSWDTNWVYYRKTVTPQTITAFYPPIKIFPADFRAAKTSGRAKVYINGKHMGWAEWTMRSSLAGSSVRVWTTYKITYDHAPAQPVPWGEYWSVGPRGVIESYGGPLPYNPNSPYAWHLE
jgi:hypothetical protein